MYNGERHLSLALDSLLAQTFTDFEIILSDNASTDGTQEICRRYMALDSRIRYYRNAENVGVARNYNAAFNRARAEYFKWASSNDVCAPAFLAECVALLDRRGDVVAVSPLTRLIYQDKTVDDTQQMEITDESACARFKYFLKHIRLNNVMNGLLRADVLRRTALHKSFRGSDVNLMAEMTLHGKFAVIPKYYFNRRMDSSSASRFRTDAQIEEMFEPKRREPLMFQSWKEDLAYFGSVRRARPSARERACLYRYLVHRMVRDRADLMADLRHACRRMVGYRAVSNR